MLLELMPDSGPSEGPLGVRSDHSSSSLRNLIRRPAALLASKTSSASRIPSSGSAMLRRVAMGLFVSSVGSQARSKIAFRLAAKASAEACVGAAVIGVLFVARAAGAGKCASNDARSLFAKSECLRILNAEARGKSSVIK